MENQLDPQVVALAKAIRQQESGGNFQARSKDGSFGAYQFIKPTWESTAKKYGVQADWESATPQQQNEVAYKQIKEWKDKGYNVGQIASMWNAGSGKPDAYKTGLQGTNKDGVQYNVAKYAESVAKLYQQFKAETGGSTSGIQPPAVTDPQDSITADREARQAAGLGVSTNPNKVKPTFAGALIRGVVKPVATLLARPVQLVKALGGATPEEQTIKSKYLGDIKTSQNAGDVIADVGRGLQTVALGIGGSGLAGGVSAGGKQALGQTIKQVALQEAKAGAIAGLGSGLEETGGSGMPTGKALGTIAKSTALGAGLGAGLGAAAPIVGKAFTKVATKTTKDVDALIGTITRGNEAEIKSARKALQDIDTSEVKTYKDFVGVLNTKIETIANKLDSALATKTNTFKLSDLKTTEKVGQFNVSHNYVNDAIEELDNFYKKTNDPVGRAELAQIKSKAKETGLTVNEINGLARKHGEVLSGYNANGELASGLTKQGAENTRKGLKKTARELFGDDAFKAADEELSHLIRTRDLADDMAKKVLEMNQKITKRGLGERVGRLLFQIADMFTLGGARGFMSAAIPRGQGLKLLNVLDAEKMLGKTLKQINTLLEKDLPEQTIIQRLEEIIQGLRGGGVSIQTGGKRPAPLTRSAMKEIKTSRAADLARNEASLRKVNVPPVAPAYKPVS